MPKQYMSERYMGEEGNYEMPACKLKMVLFFYPAYTHASSTSDPSSKSANLSYLCAMPSGQIRSNQIV